MIRGLYSLLMWLLQPGLRHKLKRRARLEPGYAQAIEERFGYYSALATPRAGPSQHLIWVHAVSLGETRAAAVLIAQLRQQIPGMRLLLTHGTATGRAQGKSLLQSGDQQVWQPWDTPGAVQRFLDHFRPNLGLLMETEIWPNLVALCKARQIPLCLVNARLSEKSLRDAQRLAWLARPSYRALTAVWSQTDVDAARLRTLGAPVRAVMGNFKFDAAPDASQLALGQVWRRQLPHPVVLFASSREGEEHLFLAKLRQWKSQGSHSASEMPVMPVQWLIVPRHPQRFDEVAQLCAQAGFSVSRRSTWTDGPRAAEVWLGDSLGEMALYFGLADVALLGGSFAPLGGQNLIEAAACACPVVMGPHTFNFVQAADLAEQSGAAFVVQDMSQGLERALLLLGDPAALEQARCAAGQLANAQRGAAQRTAAAVCALLDPLFR
ncbi:MAG: 3-deoxy-D-manno-octulosonic acid transferase [Rhodoferax sp.]|nr:3-deoxy-D-manno-octulosonic acid transferase [Rhodoferax sp.]MCF8210534.1 3-deoxy-D-manno-octulosonic acid transferase [Rhodoferax sp.]